MDYRSTGKAVRGADLVLEKAYTAFNQGKIIHALDLTLCVIHETIDLLSNADDSDGTVGEAISEYLCFMDEMIEDAELSQDQKESFFDKLIEEAASRRYDGRMDGLTGGWTFLEAAQCLQILRTSR